jgi:hypothetical protein
VPVGIKTGLWWFARTPGGRFQRWGGMATDRSSRRAGPAMVAALPAGIIRPVSDRSSGGIRLAAHSAARTAPPADGRGRGGRAGTAAKAADDSAGSMWAGRDPPGVTRPAATDPAGRVCSPGLAPRQRNNMVGTGHRCRIVFPPGGMACTLPSAQGGKQNPGGMRVQGAIGSWRIPRCEEEWAIAGARRRAWASSRRARSVCPSAAWARPRL